MDFKGKFESTIKEAKTKVDDFDIKNKLDGAKEKIEEINVQQSLDSVKEKLEGINLQQSLDSVKEKVVEFDVNSAVDNAKVKLETTVEEIKGNDNLIFKNLDSLQQVVNVVNEASAAVNDKTRNINESSIPEVLAGAIGAGAGGALSFAALYALGASGLSAVGITTGLATAGAVVGGGMVAGVFVLAAPVAVLAATGVGVTAHMKSVQLQEEKERLYKEALIKHEAIIKALKEETDASKERLDYLQSLNVLLQRAICDLEKDLNINEQV